LTEAERITALTADPAQSNRGKTDCFFPAEALLWIGQVKTLKQQGYSMKEIAKLFQDKEWLQTLSAAEPIDAAKEQPTEKPQQLSMPVPPATDHRQPGQTCLQVTINEVTSPAYMVNNNLDIEWINEQAEELSLCRTVPHSMFSVNQRALIDS
jgi:DNA-binding transcriptional MerR regulator